MLLGSVALDSKAPSRRRVLARRKHAVESRGGPLQRVCEVRRSAEHAPERHKMGFVHGQAVSVMATEEGLEQCVDFFKGTDQVCEGM